MIYLFGFVVLIEVLTAFRAVRQNQRMGKWWVVGLIVVGVSIWYGGRTGEFGLTYRGSDPTPPEQTALYGLMVLIAGVLGLVVNFIVTLKVRKARR
jgi:hypothetical protein